MKNIPKLLTYVLTLTLLGGCVTGGISLKTVKDPESSLSPQSKIFVDPYKDTEISYREDMAVAIDVAKDVGLNVVELKDAEYIMYLNFRLGLRYKSATDEFEQQLSVWETSNNVKIKTAPGDKFGVINAGVVRIGEGNRTHWEASVDVEDMEDENQVRHSLEQIFRNFGKSYKGEAEGI